MVVVALIRCGGLPEEDTPSDKIFLIKSRANIGR